MKKTIIILLIVLCISCSKKNKIEYIFITQKDYYWQYNNTCYDLGCPGINIRFEEDGYSHRYDFSVNDGYTLNEGFHGSDISNEPEKWYVKKDSTLIWNDFEYKIEHIDHTVIVLSYFLTSDKKQQCSIRLLKVVGEK